MQIKRNKMSQMVHHCIYGSNQFKTKQEQGQGHHAVVTITTELGRTIIIYKCTS